MCVVAVIHTMKDLATVEKTADAFDPHLRPPRK